MGDQARASTDPRLCGPVGRLTHHPPWLGFRMWVQLRPDKGPGAASMQTAERRGMLPFHGFVQEFAVRKAR